MPSQKELTSPCGLYCRDCLPGDEDFFNDLARFKKALDRYCFDKYAALKARSQPIFGDYPIFSRILDEIGNLRCPKPCRLGGGKPACQVRDCVENKGLDGCWECQEMETCPSLDHLRGFHELDHNLRMIRKYGVDDWTAHRGKHYLWLQ